MRTSPRKKRDGRRKAIRDKIKSGRARREWSAPSRARAVPIAAPSCNLALTPKASARNAAIELHSCKQCAYFDTAARFECMKPVPERIARKDQRNDCAFYEFRTTIEKDTAPSAPAANPSAFPERVSRPLDARQAFENLFKK